MHYFSKILLLAGLGLSSMQANSDAQLYTCGFNGKMASYHENEAKKMQLLGAECRIMNSVEHIICSMRGVKTAYSYTEAEALLYRYPTAYCEMNNQLFVSSVKQSKGLAIEGKTALYFPVNGTQLSYKNRQKINSFAHKYMNMGYTFTITGYASATGSSSKNHMLSLKRAGVVRTALLNSGIRSSEILSVDALGEESLRYNTSYEFSLNRAVIIKAYK